MYQDVFNSAVALILKAVSTLTRFAAFRPPPHILWSFVQLILSGYKPMNIWFWWSSTGQILSNLLKQTSCSSRLQGEFLSFYVNVIIPLLGPTPEEYFTSGIRPGSYVSDDHTPMEMIWVVEGENPKPSIRFAMEPLSQLDGVPLQPRDWVKIIHSLADFSFIKSFDSCWPDICYNTLINPSPELARTTAQFFLGGDFTPDGMVGKLYFIPKLRAQSENCPEQDIVTRCIQKLGPIDAWSTVLLYTDTLSHARRPTIEMVAVDCVEPSKNRVKVYFRSHDNTLDAIIEHITLGGRLVDGNAQRTVSTLRVLWGFLFPGVKSDEPLPVEESKRMWPGFLIYYELTPKCTVPFSKVYIPVRQYCKNDSQVASAVSQYLLSTNNEAGVHYLPALKQLMNHRDLQDRTGIHTYIACCGRPSAAQLSIYLSPEVFAPEREHSSIPMALGKQA